MKEGFRWVLAGGEQLLEACLSARLSYGASCILVEGHDLWVSFLPYPSWLGNDA